MSSPPVLRVDAEDPTPPYEQLRRQLVELIESGAIGPGERLPPLRQLANDLGLAVGTLARTYRELEAGGLVRSRRGGGTRVVDGLPVRAADERLREHATTYVRQARRLCASDTEALDALRQALAEN